MNKRHAKPTAQQLANRTYRRMIAMEKEIKDARAELRSALRMLSERIETIRLLIDPPPAEPEEPWPSLAKDLIADVDASRPDRIKANYNRVIDRAFPKTISTELKRRNEGCAFALLHRSGIRCAVCGELSLTEAASA